MLRLLRQYYPIRNIFFVIGEALLIFVSIYLASFLLLPGHATSLPHGEMILRITLIGVICQACLYYNDLYDLSVITSYSELSIRLFQSLGISAIFLAAIYTLFPGAMIGKGIFAVSTVFVILLIMLWRYLYRMVLTRGLFNQKIIIVGSGDLAANIVKEIQSKTDCGYAIEVVVRGPNSTGVGFSCPETTIQKTDYEGLCELARELKVERIVIALKEKRGNFPVKELLRCRVGGIDIIDGNSFYEMLTGKLIVEEINPSWLIFSDGFKKTALKRFSKRLIDIVFSILLLAIASPIILLVAVLIRLDSKGPIIFSQERVGYRRKPYMVHKFRSMITDAETKSGPVWAQTGDDRVTRVGRFIRKWRIDELPQLWNVLKGNMSFVGPRPEREHFVGQLETVIPYYLERLSVKPGVTGWAQVSYGYGASVEDAVEKLNYDLFYIKNLSILMDMMIVLRTVKTVLFGVGAR